MSILPMTAFEQAHESIWQIECRIAEMEESLHKLKGWLKKIEAEAVGSGSNTARSPGVS